MKYSTNDGVAARVGANVCSRAANGGTKKNNGSENEHTYNFSLKKKSPMRSLGPDSVWCLFYFYFFLNNKNKKKQSVWFGVKNTHTQKSMWFGWIQKTPPKNGTSSTQMNTRGERREKAERARESAPLRLPPALRLDSVMPNARRCENGLNSAKRARGTARAPPFRRRTEKIRSARSAARSARPARARPRGRCEEQLGVTVTHGRVVVRWGAIRRFWPWSNLPKSAVLCQNVGPGGGCRCGTNARAHAHAGTLLLQALARTRPVPACRDRASGRVPAGPAPASARLLARPAGGGSARARVVPPVHPSASWVGARSLQAHGAGLALP